MIRRVMTGAIACLAAALLVPVVTSSATPAAAADVVGGRITLTSPTGTPTTTYPANTPIPFSGLTSVALSPGFGPDSSAITVHVVGCSNPALRLRSFTIWLGGNLRSVAASAGADLCLVSSAALSVSTVQRGVVADTPVVGGLQYVPADPPIVLLSRTPLIANPGFGTTSRALTFPDGSVTGAAGVSLLVQLGSASVIASATVGPCDDGAPTTFTDVLVDASRDVRWKQAVVNVELPASDSLCLFASSFQGPGSTLGPEELNVTLLGTLRTSGPDPTRLPPQFIDRLVGVAPSGFVPVAPVRVLDTRSGARVDEDGIPSELDLTSRTSPTTTAVTLNVTATNQTKAGFLTVWPCGEVRPNASNLNFNGVDDVANLVTVRMPADGRLCLYSSAPTHVLADLAGTWQFGSGSRSTATSPDRILDTRTGVGAPIGKLTAGNQLVVQVTGKGGVPASAVDAVTMNLTVTAAESDGYVTAWPCDQERPDASNVNFRAGRDVPNLTTVKLSASGTVCLFSTATAHLLADVAGWMSSASISGLVDVAPARILDTRSGVGAVGAGRFPAGATQTLQVAGAGGVPASGGTSITMNMTVTGVEADGYLTVWPCDAPQPGTSNLNFRKDNDVPNLVDVKLSATGTVCIFTTASTHVLADVAAYSTTGVVP